MLNRIISNLLPYMPKAMVWLFSKRYIAGETVESGLHTSQTLNAKGILVTVDLLGEFITKIEQARANKTAYLDIISRFREQGINGNFSLKPTSFGLLIDRESCYEMVREVVVLAHSTGSFIRIDMEDSDCTDAEIDLYLRLQSEFPANVGLVLQAYLHRTSPDLARMMASRHTPATPLNFRLCKGIYVEPDSIAFKKPDEIRKNYLELLKSMLENGVYVGIATHDGYLIERALDMIKTMDLPKTAYEFQMLLGVTPNLRDRLVSAGHTVRLYVPFGIDWFGYCSRRMKENPKIVGDIVKALFIRS